MHPSANLGYADAAISEALGLKLKKLDHMENLNQGLWQGVLIDDVRVKQPKVYRQWQEHPETVCPPEGEMSAKPTNELDGDCSPGETAQGRYDRAGIA